MSQENGESLVEEPQPVDEPEDGGDTKETDVELPKVAKRHQRKSNGAGGQFHKLLASIAKNGKNGDAEATDDDEQTKRNPFLTSSVIKRFANKAGHGCVSSEIEELARQIHFRNVHDILEKAYIKVQHSRKQKIRPEDIQFALELEKKSNGTYGYTTFKSLPKKAKAKSASEDGKSEKKAKAAGKNGKSAKNGKAKPKSKAGKPSNGSSKKTAPETSEAMDESTDETKEDGGTAVAVAEEDAESQALNGTPATRGKKHARDEELAKEQEKERPQKKTRGRSEPRSSQSLDSVQTD